MYSIHADLIRYYMDNIYINNKIKLNSMFILEMITTLTILGTICFVTEKFIVDNGRGRNDSK